MAASIRSRRIAELQARAKRSDILFVHRYNSLFCLTGITRLGEKTQLWCQRLLYSMRDQYPGIEEQQQLDILQDRLDRQKDLLKRRLDRKAEAEQQERSSQRKKSEFEPPFLGAAPIERWQNIFDEQSGENK